MAKLLKKMLNKKKKKGESEGYDALHLYDNTSGEKKVREDHTYESVRSQEQYTECQHAQKSYLLVAAIDLGTSASGYAFSFRNEYESNPLQISTHTWTAGSTVLRSPKAPTCILFNPEGQFHSFGYDAQDKYALLLSEKEEHFEDWYYFENFKMSLYENKELTIHTEIQATNSKSMKAITVFSESLKYLKNHLQERCFNMKVGLKDTDVLWILTVPAIWNDGAKHFMRRAAELARIPRNQLLIGLEPEVGAIFCKHVPVGVERVDDGGAEKMNAFKPGTCYMVVDAGGGTIDVTVHEVISNNNVREIQAANGGPWGGNSVNKEYLKYLRELFGNETFDEFRTKSMDDYADMLREFEMKKQNMKIDGTRVILRLPVSLMKIYQRNNTENELTSRIQILCKGKAEIKKDKIFFAQDIFDNFFTKTTDAIVNHLDTIISRNGRIMFILLIGGFSDSVILQQQIRKHFTSKQIIVPCDAGLCVLKGAVLFGHKRELVESRVLRYTYGIECSTKFREGLDPNKKYMTKCGIWMCEDIFCKIAEMGDSVQQGQVSKERFVVVDEPNMEYSDIDIYVSTIIPTPRYTTEIGCRKIGFIYIQLEGNKQSTKRCIYFRLTFGDTEIKVQYRQDDSLEYKEKLLDLLGEHA